MSESSDPIKLILVPDDIPGSWDAMLRICDRRDRDDDYQDWDHSNDYTFAKARRSPLITKIIRAMAKTELRTKCRIGGNLWGLAVSLPRESKSNVLVSINVTPLKKFEIRILDLTGNGIRAKVLDECVCEFDDSVAKIIEFTGKL